MPFTFNPAAIIRTRQITLSAPYMLELSSIIGSIQHLLTHSSDTGSEELFTLLIEDNNPTTIFLANQLLTVCQNYIIKISVPPEVNENTIRTIIQTKKNYQLPSPQVFSFKGNVRAEMPLVAINTMEGTFFRSLEFDGQSTLQAKYLQALEPSKIRRTSVWKIILRNIPFNLILEMLPFISTSKIILADLPSDFNLKPFLNKIKSNKLIQHIDLEIPLKSEQIEIIKAWMKENLHVYSFSYLKDLRSKLFDRIIATPSSNPSPSPQPEKEKESKQKKRSSYNAVLTPPARKRSRKKTKKDPKQLPPDTLVSFDFLIYRMPTIWIPQADGRYHCKENIYQQSISTPAKRKKFTTSFQLKAGKKASLESLGFKCIDQENIAVFISPLRDHLQSRLACGLYHEYYKNSSSPQTPNFWQAIPSSHNTESTQSTTMSMSPTNGHPE